TSLAEARAEHHRVPHTRRRAFGDDARHAPRRHDDDREVDRLRQVADAGVGTHAVELGVARIDRIDGAPVAVLAQEAQWAAADAGRIGRGADDGNRARLEESVQAHLVAMLRRPATALECLYEHGAPPPGALATPR